MAAESSRSLCELYYSLCLSYPGNPVAICNKKRRKRKKKMNSIRSWRGSRHGFFPQNISTGRKWKSQKSQNIKCLEMMKVSSVSVCALAKGEKSMRSIVYTCLVQPHLFWPSRLYRLLCVGSCRTRSVPSKSGLHFICFSGLDFLFLSDLK